MRIVQVTNVSGAREGTHQALARLRSAYRAAGHDVVLVAPGARREVVAGDEGLTVRLRAPQLRRSAGQRLLLDARSLHRMLRALGPEALEVCGRSTLAGLGAWARAHDVPALALASRRVDALLDRRAPGWLPTRGLAEAFAQRLAGRFDTVVCASSWAQSEFTRLGLGNAVVVPPGVDLTTFHPVRRRPALRAALGGGAEVLLACLGPLDAARRPALAVDTLRVLLRRGVDARLVVAGCGPAEPVLRAAAADLPALSLIPPPKPEETAALLASVDVLLCPAPGEGPAPAALAALASGTPVVATRSGPVGELLDGPGSGAVTWSHPAAFAGAVEGLLAVPAAERRCAARAAAERFPWQAAAQRMLALHGAHPPATPAGARAAGAPTVAGAVRSRALVPG